MINTDQPNELTKGGLSGVQKRILLGSIFLMVTSSVGPAFLTKTAVFTAEHKESFSFVIFISFIMALAVHLNIWRVMIASGKRGQDVANMVLPGLGSLIAILVVMGGLVFNIGNVAGAGLGLMAIFGVSPKVGAIISAIIAVGVFSIKNSGKAMDIFALVLGIVMIIMMIITFVVSNPPLLNVAVNTIFPTESINLLLFPFLAVIGGLAGGYNAFVGGHRLIDAGIVGKENVPFAGIAAFVGALLQWVIGTILFLAVLGVVTSGHSLNMDNPAASAFELALGNVGYKAFGVILFSAGLTSVIGTSYTSVSFLRTFHPLIKKYNNFFIIGFIAIAALTFLSIGQPVTILVLVGALNGLILPIALGSILIASRKKKIVGDYHHPMWMIIIGVIAVIISVIAGWISLQGIADLWTN